MSRGNKWVPIDKYLSQYFVKIKRPYSEIEAMFSYTLDIDNGKSGSIMGYSIQWEWSRNKVRRFLNGIRTVKGHIKDSKRTQKGHPIHFIDKALMNKKDSKRTVKGHIKDSKRYTTTNPKPNPNKKKNIYKDICNDLITEINKLGNKSFRKIQSNYDFIIPRLKEGFSKEDCLTVIKNKNLDPNFNIQYFKPETLFRKSKFEGYLNEDPTMYKKFGAENNNHNNFNEVIYEETKPEDIAWNK